MDHRPQQPVVFLLRSCFDLVKLMRSVESCVMSLLGEGLAGVLTFLALVSFSIDMIAESHVTSNTHDEKEDVFF